MKKTIEYIIGILFTTIGFTGWILIVESNRQGGVAIMCWALCVATLATGLMLLHDGCGFGK